MCKNYQTSVHTQRHGRRRAHFNIFIKLVEIKLYTLAMQKIPQRQRKYTRVPCQYTYMYATEKTFGLMKQKFGDLQSVSTTRRRQRQLRKRCYFCTIIFIRAEDFVPGCCLLLLQHVYNVCLH